MDLNLAPAGHVYPASHAFMERRHATRQAVPDGWPEGLPSLRGSAEQHFPRSQHQMAATLRCTTALQHDIHSPQLKLFSSDRQADAASPSGVAETLHFGSNRGMRCPPHMHDPHLRHAPQQGSSRSPEACYMMPHVSPQAPHLHDTRRLVTRTDLLPPGSAPSCCAAVCSGLSNPNSPCSGHLSHNASGAHFDVSHHVPQARLHHTLRKHCLHGACPAESRRFVQRAPAALQKLCHHAPAPSTLHAPSQAQVLARARPTAALQAFHNVLELDTMPPAAAASLRGDGQRGSVRDATWQYSMMNHNSMLAAPTASTPSVAAAPLQQQRTPARAHGLRHVRPQRPPQPQPGATWDNPPDWRPRATQFHFDTMLQQVERLHACEGAPALPPQPALKRVRRVTAEDVFCGHQNPPAAPQVCMEAWEQKRRVRRRAVPQQAREADVRGYQSHGRPQQEPGGLRTWEVMHDIASTPGAQWHLESLNDLAGLLGGEAVPEARPAPPEWDAASGVGCSGAVCGGLSTTQAVTWRQGLVVTEGVLAGGAMEGFGENCS